MRLSILFIMLFIVNQSFAVQSQEISVKSEIGTLYGTLELPESVNKPPVALIIAGSGPTDRDGNNSVSGKSNNLKLLAESLSKNGIASLRYDKRGIAQSKNAVIRESDVRFDDFISDAVMLGEYLRNSGKFSNLVIIGHSEGALIGAVAAEKLKADGFVSISGAGRPAYEIIEEQIKKSSPAFSQETEAIIKQLKEGKTVDNVSPALAPLFRTSVQPYLISWFKYIPTETIGRLKMPVLIIQGTTDIQITAKDAKLLAASNKRAKLILINGMNHVLKEAPADIQKQIDSYNEPTLPLSKELPESIILFISELSGQNK